MEKYYRKKITVHDESFYIFVFSKKKDLIKFCSYANKHFILKLDTEKNHHIFHYHNSKSEKVCKSENQFHKLKMCVATISIDACLAATTHRSNQIGEKSLWNAVPKIGEKSLWNAVTKIGEKSLWNAVPKIGEKSLWNAVPKIGEKSLWNAVPNVDQCLSQLVQRQGLIPLST